MVTRYAARDSIGHFAAGHLGAEAHDQQQGSIGAAAEGVVFDGERVGRNLGHE